MGRKRAVNTRILLGVMFTINIVIVAYAILASIHADMASYLTLVGPVLTVMISLLVVGENQAKAMTTSETQTATLNANTAKLEAIGKQVDGKLDDQFTQVHKRIDTLDKVIEPAIPVVVQALKAQGNETAQ